MDWNIVVTALLSVVVFLMGQFIFKFIIAPVDEFRKARQYVANTLLRCQHKIINPEIPDKLSSELKKHAATVYAARNTIFWESRFLRFSFCLPTKKEVLEASRHLNLLSQPQENPNTGLENQRIRAVKEIGFLLRIPTSYETEPR